MFNKYSFVIISEEIKHYIFVAACSSVIIREQFIDKQ